MKLEEFKKVIKNLCKLSERTGILYDNSVDLVDYNNDFHIVITDLLSIVFNKKQLEWFDWYCLEQDYGRLKEPGAWDKEGNPIAYDDESLYKLIKSLEDE